MACNVERIVSGEAEVDQSEEECGDSEALAWSVGQMTQGSQVRGSLERVSLM